MNIGTLLGDEHGVLAVTIVVLLDEDARPCRCTNAILAVTVEIVVEDVQVL